MSTRGQKCLGTELGRYAAAFRFDDLPADVIEKLKACIFFNLGIAIAGAPLVRQGVGVATRFPTADGRAARVLVVGTSVPPAQAAFANALMMHARAQDDFQHCANAHIGTVATPAILALADWHESDGRSFLAANAVAYQVATILGDGFAAITTPRGFRATGIYGTPGAAAGCARILGLNETQAAHAIGLAASLASGIGQPWVSGSMEWRLQIAHASRTAVDCALLAQAGLDAAPDAYEGRYGFYMAHAGTAPRVEEMLARLYGPWRTESIGFKPLPVCAINQGPAINAIEVQRTTRIAPEQIAAIEIQLPGEDVAYPGIAATGPIRSAGEALMRSAFVVAVCLSKGCLSYTDLEIRDDPKVLALAERTRVVANNALPPLSHVLKIEVRDHSLVERPFQASDREFILGRPEIRMVLHGIRDELALSFDRIDMLEDAIWRLDNNTRPTDLVSLLVQGEGERRRPPSASSLQKSTN